jgi:hypothetical protein
MTIKERFIKLDGRRKTLLDRAVLCSKLTIPALMPDEYFTENDELPTPYQSLGANAVNSLSNRLLLTLLPPNQPFFRYDVDRNVLDRLKAELGKDDYKIEVEDKLSKAEKAVQGYIDRGVFRDPVYRAIRLLVTTGNALCHFPDDGKVSMRVFRLNNYVVQRDSGGNVVEIITRESTSLEAIKDADLREFIKANTEHNEQSEGYVKEKDLEIYTRVILNDNNRYDVSQEVGDVEIPDSKGEYKADELPWIVLRWVGNDGEDYGRGHVEEHLGDFISLESLSQSSNESAAALSKLIFLVRPNGVTNVEDLIDTPNTGFCQGDPNDVAPLQANKINDFKIAYDMITKLEQRIERAFLMHKSVQRQADRVTAEEVRYMASELEDTLGGIYSILSQEFQRPFLNNVVNKMVSEGAMPALPKNIIQPIIITGLEALGRGHDLNKLNVFLQNISAGLGPQTVTKYLKVGPYITRVAASLGIDTEGLVSTDEEVAARDKQAMMNSLSEKAGPGVAQEIARGVIANQQNQNQG